LSYTLAPLQLKAELSVVEPDTEFVCTITTNACPAVGQGNFGECLTAGGVCLMPQAEPPVVEKTVKNGVDTSGRRE